MTRWSRTITQSETYSSIPCRVSAPSPRSPVITAVTPRAFSQPSSRRSSERRWAALVRTPKRFSIVSSTTRVALTSSMAAPSRMNNASRSHSPDVVQLGADQVRRGRPPAGRPPGAGSGRSRASATLTARSSAVSSKATKTPGSPNSVMPRTRNSMPSRVLPQPAGPQTRVARPRGNPPPVISSSPEIPVSALGSDGSPGRWVTVFGAGRTVSLMLMDSDDSLMRAPDPGPRCWVRARRAGATADMNPPLTLRSVLRQVQSVVPLRSGQ